MISEMTSGYRKAKRQLQKFSPFESMVEHVFSAHKYIINVEYIF